MTKGSSDPEGPFVMQDAAHEGFIRRSAPGSSFRLLPGPRQGTVEGVGAGASVTEGMHVPDPVKDEIERRIDVVASLEPAGTLALVTGYLLSAGYVTLTWQDPLLPSPPLADVLHRLQPLVRPHLGPPEIPGSAHPLWPGAAAEVEARVAPLLAAIAVEHSHDPPHHPPRAAWATDQLAVELLVALALSPAAAERLDDRETQLISRLWQQVVVLAATPADRVDIMHAIVHTPWTAGAGAAREYADYLATVDVPSGLIRWNAAVRPRLAPFEQIHLDMLVILRVLWLNDGRFRQRSAGTLMAQQPWAEALKAVRRLASAAALPSTGRGPSTMGLSMPFGPVAAAGRLGLDRRWEAELLRCRAIQDGREATADEWAVASMVLAPGYHDEVRDLITTIGLLFVSDLIAAHLKPAHSALLQQMWDDVVAISNIPPGAPTQTAAMLVSMGWKGTGRELAADSLIETSREPSSRESTR